MIQVSLLAGGLIASMMLGHSYAPVLWSPDGRWLAHTQAVRPADDMVVPGWMVDAADNRSMGGELGAHSSGGVPRSYRLWATRVETGESVLLEESEGPLSPPAWKPNGTAIAFGRLVPGKDRRARFEVVVQDGPDVSNQRIISTEVVTEWTSEAKRLAVSPVAWSGDGRLLAVPRLQPSGLAVLRVDDGKLLRTLPDASLPAWSPEGGELAYYRSSQPDGLYCFKPSHSEPRRLADVHNASRLPPPAWSRDGASVIVIRPVLVAGDHLQAELDRVRIEAGQVEPIRNSIFADSQPLARGRVLASASFSLDPEGEDLFLTSSVEGRPHQISWVRPGRGEVKKHFNPLSFEVPYGALAVSPIENRLAVRAGAGGLFAPPAICDPDSETLTPVVVDDSARAEWLSILINAAKGMLQDPNQVPASRLNGSVIERPTLLPSPGELAPGDLSTRRLRRIAALGRPLCDRPAGSAPAEPGLRILIDESRFFFDYLLADYAAASSELDIIEARADHPDLRRRLLALRVQVDLGMREFERADGAIRYLRATRRQPVLRLQETPQGPTVKAIADPSANWSDYLSARAEAVRRTKPEDSSSAHLPGPLGADGPEPLRLDRLPEEFPRNLPDDFPGIAPPAPPPRPAAPF